MAVEEQVDLVVNAKTEGAQRGLQSLMRAMGGLGGALQETQQETQETSGRRGFGGLMPVLQQFFSAAGAGATGAKGLAMALGAFNPVAGLVMNGIRGIIGWLSNLRGEITQTVGQAQTLTINLESLAARELVKAGAFENATEALDTAKVKAQQLLREIQLLGLESPFENSLVVQTFQQGMAFGFTSEQAMRLTRASLDLASGLGLSGYEMSVIGMVMGQIRSSGKLMGQDLMQLRSRGINLADMLQDQLGVSIEQFNAGLKTGKYNMDDLLDVFGDFAATNFAGAGKRMARTFQGIMSTLQDLKETAITTIFKDPFDQVTAAASDALDVVTNFVTQSGLLEKVGAVFSDLVEKAIALGRTLIGWVKPGFDFLTNLQLQQNARDLAGWWRLIGANLKQVADIIINFVSPAIEWFQARWAAIDWSPALVHLRDTVNAAGQIIYNLVETIRRLLSGSDNAFMPLRQALSYVLTWIAMTWERFAAGALTWGWNLIVQVANGMAKAANSVLSKVMTAVGNAIGRFLKPGSPPKEGPLSHIIEWGRGVVTEFLRAFETADFDLLKRGLAPIKQALQDAVAAGNIDEVEFNQIYASVREDVAALIATFRETGEISAEALGSIGEKLGEGGDEFTKLLRLQLEYQQAMENLKAVSDEYAEAQASGAVTQEMRDRLKAAQAEADAAKDKVSWQEAFIEAQRESIDIQLKLAQAIDKLAEALKDADKAGKGGGAGAEAPTQTPALDIDLSDLGAGVEGTKDLDVAIRGVSEEFREMRRQVDAFLDTPFAQHVENIVSWLAQATGLDFTRLLLFFTGMAKFNWQDLAGAVGRLAGQVWLFILTELPGALTSANSFLLNVWAEVLHFVERNGPQWARWLGSAIGSVAGKAFTFLVQDLPGLALSFVQGLYNVLWGTGEWIDTNGNSISSEWARAFFTIVGDWITFIKSELPTWLMSLIEIASELVGGFMMGFVENSPDWYQDAVASALIFVQKLKDGITGAWDLLSFLEQLVRTWIAQTLFNYAAWVDRVKETGRTLIDKIKSGINGAWDLYETIKGKFITLVANLQQNTADYLAGLGSIGSTFVKTITDAITNAWNAVGEVGFVAWFANLIGEAVNNAVGQAATWATSMYNAGLDVVQGMIDGIKYAARNLLSAFIDLMEQLPEWAKKLLGINSPSTIFFSYGVDTIKGYELGAVKAFNALQSTLNRMWGTVALAPDIMQASNLSVAASMPRQAAGGLSVAPITVQQYFGENSLSFPNVRDGRDAAGVKRELMANALTGIMSSRTVVQ